MPTPAWLAPVSGYPGLAGAVNQLLGYHGAVYLYPGGTTLVSSPPGSAAYQSTASQWLAQSFTAPAAAGVAVQVQVSAVGGSPVSPAITPLVLSLYADGTSSGSPGPYGTALATASLSCEYVYSQPFWVSWYAPLSSLTAGSTYWVTAQEAGGASAYYAWQQASGGAAGMTSANGTTWTSLSSGLMLQVAGNGASGQVTGITEDDGARVTTFTWTGALLTGISEVTVAQGGGSLIQSRTVTWSSGLPMGVA